MKKVLLMMMVLVAGLVTSASAQSGYSDYLTMSLGESNVLPVQAQVTYVEFSTPWFGFVKNLTFNSIGATRNIPEFITGSSSYKMTQITISCSYGSVTFSASEIPEITDSNSKTVGEALITIKNDGDGLYEIAANALP